MRSNVTLVNKNKHQIKQHNVPKNEIIQHTHTKLKWPNTEHTNLQSHSMFRRQNTTFLYNKYSPVNSTIRVDIAGIQQAHDSSN